MDDTDEGEGNGDEERVEDEDEGGDRSVLTGVGRTV